MSWVFVKSLQKTDLLTLNLSFTHTLIWQVIYWVPTMPLALQWWGSLGLWIPDNLLYSHIIAGAEKVCVICSIQIFQLQFWVFRPWRLVLLCCVTGAYLGICLFPFETGRPTILHLPGNREGVNTDVCLWVRRGESSFLWLWRPIPLASEWERGQLLPVQSTGYNRFPASALKVTLGLPDPQPVLAIWCWDSRTIPSPLSVLSRPESDSLRKFWKKGDSP